MAAIPLGYLIAASGALSAVSAISQGNQQSAAAKSQANMAEYNAKMSQIQAEQTYATAGVQEDLQRKRARAALGTQMAAGAQAGGGLNSDLLRESLYGAENDALAIRYEGALKANGLASEGALQQSSAGMLRNQAGQAKTGGYLSAAGSLMSAGASYAGSKAKLNK